MTEEEWQSSVCPKTMLQFLHERPWIREPPQGSPLQRLVTDRRLRLFAAACMLSQPEYRSPHWDDTCGLTAHGEANAAIAVADGAPMPRQSWTWCLSRIGAQAAVQAHFGRPSSARMLREIFGNPFQQPVLLADHRSKNVRDLAQTIYTERVFNRMPILGDALEETGYTDMSVLDHCHKPCAGNGLVEDPHAVGCWVLDLVLEKV